MVTYKWFPSPSYTYDDHRVDAIILHTTEGAQTNDSIKNYLTGHNGVSYHGSVDNFMLDVCYEYVYETDKSWSCCNYNGRTLNYVFCTPSGASANWSRDYWLNNQYNMLRTMAHVVADQAAQWNVPLVALTSSQVQSGQRGIAQHMNLGADGCGHSDCGNMPMDEIIRLASGVAVGGPIETPPKPPSNLFVEDVFMGVIPSDKPLVLPVPDGAAKLFISAKPAAFNTDHVVVVTSRYDMTKGTWTSDQRMDCSSGHPRQELNVADYELVSMQVENPQHSAGYGFA